MGDLISLASARAARRRPVEGPPRRRVTFWFDLASPETYLAAERLERSFGAAVDWRPAYANALAGAPAPGDPLTVAAQRHAEERAAELRMPLVWPDRFPFAARPAMRVAVLAVDQGHGGEFVLAASRLAFCGGFDLDDFEVLSEAAAAAGLPLEACLAAAGDRSLDAELEERALRLSARGASRLPVLEVGQSLFCGEDRVPEAAAAARVPRAG